MHFGLPPRFAADVKTIQIDIDAEEIGRNVPAEVGLVGDIKAIVGPAERGARRRALPLRRPTHPGAATLGDKVEENKTFVQNMMNDDAVPDGLLPRAARDPGAGAARHDHPGRGREHDGHQPQRADALAARANASTPATFGTMGVGLAQAIAAQVVHPDRKVVCIEGDSAFGFSGMEVETACRYRLPIVFVIINNNGIGMRLRRAARGSLPVPRLGLHDRGGLREDDRGLRRQGLLVRTPTELSTSLKQALDDTMPSIINVHIDPHAKAKPQKHHWLTA